MYAWNGDDYAVYVWIDGKQPMICRNLMKRAEVYRKTDKRKQRKAHRTTVRLQDTDVNETAKQLVVGLGMNIHMNRNYRL